MGHQTHIKSTMSQLRVNFQQNKFMAELQMSQTGPFLFENSLLAARIIAEQWAGIGFSLCVLCFHLCRNPTGGCCIGGIIWGTGGIIGGTEGSAMAEEECGGKLTGWFGSSRVLAVSPLRMKLRQVQAMAEPVYDSQAKNYTNIWHPTWKNKYSGDIFVILQFWADAKDLILAAHIWWQAT